MSDKSIRMAWAALMMAGAASAADPPASPHAGGAPDVKDVADQSQLEALGKKLRLVKLLFEQSPSLQRIPSSNNAQAKEMLKDAQAMYAKAVGEVEAKRGEAALKLLDESLKLIVAAAHLEPNAAAVAAKERARYLELQEAIRNFQALHQSLAARLVAKNPKATIPELDRGNISNLVERAAALAADGKVGEANRLLSNAHTVIVESLNSMLKAETFTYDLKFNTPADEFTYEMARYRSYEELLPIALAQFNPAPDARALSDGLVQKSRVLRDQAQKSADGGDHRTAIKTLQEASGRLQSALRIVGVVTMQTEESKP